MKITKLLLWVAYFSFVLSFILIIFSGIILIKKNFNNQEINSESLSGVISKSTTFKLELPLNLNIEYYFHLNNNEISVNSYFLKIQQKYIKTARAENAAVEATTYPKLKMDNIYEMPDSEAYVYISIPYSSVKSVVNIWLIYFLLTSATLLLTILLIIKFLRNCDKGNFFIPSNAKYIRVISYLVIGYSLFRYAIQWVIFNSLNNNLNELVSIKVNSVLDFNLTYLLAALLMVIIAQAFKEGVKLKEEQNLTI